MLDVQCAMMKKGVKINANMIQDAEKWCGKTKCGVNNKAILHNCINY